MEASVEQAVTVRLITSKEGSNFLHKGCMLDQADPRLVTPEAIAKSLATWTLVGIFDKANTLVGVAGADEHGFGHIHVAQEAHFQWAIRSVCFDIMKAFFEKHEVVSFSIPVRNMAARKLAIYCGGIFLQKDYEMTLYRVTLKDLHASPCAPKSVKTIATYRTSGGQPMQGMQYLH